MRIVLAATSALVLALAGVWYSSRDSAQTMIPSNEPDLSTTLPVTQQSKTEKFNLALARDDHSGEEQAYQESLNAKVDAVIAGGAAEHDLPTMALPLLQNAIAGDSVPAPTAQRIKDALAEDHVRLANAIATQKRLDWFRKNTLDIFEKDCGTESWAPAARAALQAQVRFWDEDPRALSDDDMIVWHETRAAYKEGRIDPLLSVAMLQNIFHFGADNTQRGWMRGLSIAAARNIKKAGFGPFIRLSADLLAVECIALDKPVTDRNHQEMARLLTECKSLFGELLADPELPRQALLVTFSNLRGTSAAVFGDQMRLTSDFIDQLKASKVDPGTVLTVQGFCNVQWAWEARGTGYADTVTEEGARRMVQRLADADNELEQAWQLDPTNRDAATEMLTVELGQGQGRDRMETWFNRAMAADSDNYEACANKLYYLEPKWYGKGDGSDMLDFGQQCVAGGNYDAGIPYILIDAYMSLAHYTNTGITEHPQAQYFHDHPDCWDEIRKVFIEDRRHRPSSVRKDLEFTVAAIGTEHWDEANFLFQEAGKMTDVRVYSPEEMKKANALVAQHHPSSTRPAGFDAEIFGPAITIPPHARPTTDQTGTDSGDL